MSRPSETTIKRLFSVSSNRCAFPKCTTPLVHGTKVTARISHIRAQSPGGPRYDPQQSDEDRHAFDNLLLLCGAHADVIDADEEAYSVKRLTEMKKAHESGATHVPQPGPDIINALIANSEVDAHSSTFVTSFNQSGGITAGTVNVNAAPEPQLHMREIFANKAEAGRYHSRVELTVESPYPPGNLYVAVHAPSIISMDLSPQRSGAVIMGHCGTREGFAFANLQSPYGRINLDVLTKKPERFEIEWDIQ